jgi:hypothetical protein
MPVAPAYISAEIYGGAIGSIVYIGSWAISPRVLWEVYLVICITDWPEQMSTLVSPCHLTDAYYLDETAILDVSGSLWVDGSGMYTASATPHLQVQVTELR